MQITNHDPFEGWYCFSGRISGHHCRYIHEYHESECFIVRASFLEDFLTKVIFMSSVVSSRSNTLPQP